MAAAGEDAQADRQFLHHVEDGDQQHLQGQQPIAPLHPALPGGDHAAHVGIGQHYHQTGTEHCQGAGKAPMADSHGWDVTHVVSVHGQLIVTRPRPGAGISCE